MYHLLSMGMRLCSFNLPVGLQTKSVIFSPNSLTMVPRGCCSTVSMMQRPVMAACLKVISTFQRRTCAERVVAMRNKRVERSRVRMG